MTSLLSFLIELRTRFLRVIYVLCAVFGVLFYFSDKLFSGLALPLIHSLPNGQTLIATGIATPLIIPLRFSFIVSMMVCAPYILYQLWAFIAPALYRHERRFVLLLAVPSIVLFYSGMAFAYWVVFPLIFSFFASITPTHVQLMPDINAYLDFTMTLLLAFGITFEVPIFTAFLVVSGLVTHEQLSQTRPYFIVFAFVIGMLLTPPDVLSQVLLAVPMCLLYEVGLLFARFLSPGVRKQAA